MKVTFPHMGNLYIPVKALLTSLGVDVIVPPKSSKRTISIGSRHAPETACLPLKVNIGNYIEAFEMGADTILMAGGVGPCRFGLYGEVQREILKDLGYDFDIIILEPPRGHFMELVKGLRRMIHGVTFKDVLMALHLAWDKIIAADRIGALDSVMRPREWERGLTTKVAEETYGNIDNAVTRSEVAEALEAGIHWLKSIPCDLDRDILQIGLVGEIYTVLEPFVNLNIIKILGDLGVQVDSMISISDWINSNILLDSVQVFLPWNRRRMIEEWARPYLNHFVGGDGIDSIAHSVKYACKGYDGIIHLLPLTCMPEIVAKTILPVLSKDLGIPVMSLVLDEHSSETGFYTRIEAFVDLVKRRKKKSCAQVISLAEERCERVFRTR
jgi:predicted nucleotide-binding protein (sugar kinase/HSP70/actin superfamily)